MNFVCAGKKFEARNLIAHYIIHVYAYSLLSLSHGTSIISCYLVRVRTHIQNPALELENISLNAEIHT